MKYQQGLEADNQAWGSSLWGSGSHGLRTQDSNLVEDTDGGLPRVTAGLQYLPPFSPGFGENSSVFSPIHFFPPSAPQQQQLQQQQQPQQQHHQQHQHLQPQASGLNFNWQSLLGGQPGSLQSQASLQRFASGADQGLAPLSSFLPQLHQESNQVGEREADGDGTSDLSLGDDSGESEGSSDGELDRSSKGKRKLSKSGKVKVTNARRSKGSKAQVVKREEWDFQALETPRDVAKVKKKKHKQENSRERYGASKSGHPKDSMNFEILASSSETESSSDDSDKNKEEAILKKRKRAGQDADGNVTWTDESVRFLFETYDAIHRRLWEESNGQVKYQKKWTPILKAMQDQFGKHFTKKQCQSKYWSVRRECTDYRYMSAKAARTDPSWNPSIVGRELLKPKFYDVWFEVSGKNQALATTSHPPKNSAVVEDHHHRSVGKVLNAAGPSEPSRQGGQSSKRGKDCGSAIKEMQRLMQVQLQTSEKREEAMKNRAELMMDLLTQHMQHMENRVNHIEGGQHPDLQILERVNNKLEKVLDGFSALNKNLSTIAVKLSQPKSSTGPSR